MSQLNNQISLLQLKVNKANVQRVNEILYANHDAGLINDEELLLLADRNVPRNLYFLYWHYQRFDLEQMDDNECKAEFRFRKDDVYILTDAHHLPPEIDAPSLVAFHILVEMAN